MQNGRNGRLFWPILIAIVAADAVTKWIAVQHLNQFRVPTPVFGEWVRLTLVYNPGAAFGLHVGEHSRWVFTVLTVGALMILGWLYLSTRADDRMRIVSLGLVCGGAVGNLIDRIKAPHAVIDFLDVGVGDARWPTFNVADIAVSVGACLLAIVLWSDDRPGETSTLGVVPHDLRRESSEAT